MILEITTPPPALTFHGKLLVCGLHREVSSASVLLGVHEERDIVILCGSLALNKLCWGPEAVPGACGLPSSWRWLVLPPVSFPSGFGSPPPTFQLLGECLLLNARKQLLSLGSSYLYVKCPEVAVGKEPQWRRQHAVLFQGQKGRQTLSRLLSGVQTIGKTL